MSCCIRLEMQMHNSAGRLAITHCRCFTAASILQEQVQGYSALSQQLAQDYNTHAAAVMGQAPPAGATVAAAAATAGSSSRGATAAGAAAAASGQAGAEVMQDMAEEERKRFKKQAGAADTCVCQACMHR